MTSAHGQPVSAPIRVQDRLAAAADGPVQVLHRGEHAVYVDLDGWCVGVVDRVATRVPCAMRTGGVGLPEARSATVRAGVLHLDDVPFPVGRYVETRVRAIRVAASSPAPLSADRVAALVGSGGGLTPYGDDVLCGWLAAHRAAGIATPEVDDVVRALAHRTTLLSATLLDCALHGEVLPEFDSWLGALGTDAEPAWAALLAAVGHTSGLGLLEGARQALSGLRPLTGVAA